MYFFLLMMMLWFGTIKVVGNVCIWYNQSINTKNVSVCPCSQSRSGGSSKSDQETFKTNKNRRGWNRLETNQRHHCCQAIKQLTTCSKKKLGSEDERSVGTSHWSASCESARALSHSANINTVCMCHIHKRSERESSRIIVTVIYTATIWSLIFWYYATKNK